MGYKQQYLTGSYAGFRNSDSEPWTMYRCPDHTPRLNYAKPVGTGYEPYIGLIKLSPDDAKRFNKGA